VSIDTLGFQADGSQPSISADGNKVAFVSTSGRLTSGYPGGAQVYVRDMSQAVTVLASDGVDGHESNGMCEVPVISADGDHVVFDSYASNLVPGVPNGWEQVFERDLATSTTTWVSQSLSGQPDDDSYYSSVSANGRMVAFESRAGNLVSGDTNDAVDVFVRDMQAGVTSRISLATGGAQTAGDTGFRPVSISASGERVAFTFYEAGLVPNETAVRVGTFVHDMVAGTTTETSVASDGSATASGADAAALSPDGAFQAFEAVFTGATQVDRSSSPGVFLRRLG
jgi:Tol biopolymer transport system component